MTGIVYLGEVTTKLLDGTDVVCKIKEYHKPSDMNMPEVLVVDFFWLNGVEVSDAEKGTFSQEDWESLKLDCLQYADEHLQGS